VENKLAEVTGSQRYPRRLLTQIIDWFFPLRCVGCQTIGEALCQDCVKKIAYIHSPFCDVCGTPFFENRNIASHSCIDSKYLLRIRSSAEFSGVIRKSLIALKYRHQRHMAETLIQCCASQWPVADWHIEAIVPIPTNPKKERERGYNQAKLLADAYAHFSGLPQAPHLLRKEGNINTQVGLSAKERKQNVNNAFQTNPCRNSTLLLIDDVCTTGATMQSAAQALIEAGARQVYGVTIARAVLTSPR
jgi:competence protein ComFC